MIWFYDILNGEYTHRLNSFANMSITQPVALTKSIPVVQVRYNQQGLVPAIVQDYLDGTVLMMAWMNQES